MSKMICDPLPPQPSAEFSTLVREKRENAIGYLVTIAQKALHRELGERLHKHGVSVAQWAVLVALWEKDGLSQKKISQCIAVEMPTLSRTVDRMERDGLVVRVRNADDRRQVNIFLTEHGAGLWHDLVVEAHANQTQAMQGFTEDEKDILRTLLKRVIANMNQGCPSATKSSVGSFK